MEERTLLKLLIIAIIILTASLIGNVLLYMGIIAANSAYIPPAASESLPSAKESLSYMDYSGAYFESADLSRINAYKTKFTGADMRGADLHGSTLTLSDLSGADLRDADLVGAKLDYANLRGADLRKADLSYADLRGADLTGADLTGAIIEGADITYTTGEYKR